MKQHVRNIHDNVTEVCDIKADGDNICGGRFFKARMATHKLTHIGMNTKIKCKHEALL